MTYFYILLVLAGGILIPVQAGINMSLSGKIESSAVAALISFIVGTLGLIAYISASRIPWPTLDRLVSLPFWLWTGGLCGAYLVWISIVVAPKIGAAVLVALLVAGQLGASLLLDHFGWLGFATREMSLGRITGSLLLIAGVLMIRKF